MQTPHRPQSWTVHHSGLVLADGGATSIAYAGPDRAQVFHRGTEVATMAVARMIAAAPRMAAAIRDAVHCFDVLGYELPFDIQNELRAALNEAEGR